MSSEFSLLSHLNVAIPQTFRESRPSSAAAREPVILRARGGPPTAHKQQPQSQSNTPAKKSREPSRAAFNETEEVLHVQREGRTIEYKIFNSTIPCNTAYNDLAAAERKRNKNREVPSDTGMLIGEAEGTHSRNARTDELRSGLQQQMESARARKAQEQQHLRDVERRMLDELTAREQRERTAELEAKQRRRQDFSALSAALQETARQKKQRVADTADQVPSVISDFSDAKPVDPQIKRQHQLELQRYWLQQMEQRRAREGVKPVVLNNEDWFFSNHREDPHVAARARSAQALRDVNRHLADSKRDASKRREEEERHAERLLAFRGEQEEFEKKQQEREAKARQQVAYQNQVRRQIEESIQRHRRGSERPPQPETEHKILIRCPVTGKLLPPSNFNVPAQYHRLFYQE